LAGGLSPTIFPFPDLHVVPRYMAQQPINAARINEYGLRLMVLRFCRA